MRLVFVSNYYNHHQKALCDALLRRCGEFCFISTSVMSEDRRQLGYGIEEPSYVIHGYESEYFEQAESAIRNADVVLYGAARGVFSDPRMYRNKTVFYYSERIYKTGCNIWQLPLKAIRYYRRFEHRQNSFLLCSGAYTAADFSKTGTFKNRCFQWGYFPETKRYDIKGLLAKKDKNKLLWCGRLLSWKHPEYAVETARKLSVDGVLFSMDIIGIGPEKERLNELIERYGLQDRVRLLGAMKPEQVREHMEAAGVFLFTSDRQEGWGAVLNEAMNSGCAVVASHLIGSVPYLVKNGENGWLFVSGDSDMLYERASYLLQRPDVQERFGAAAYSTVTDLWNADTAAERFVTIANAALRSEQFFKRFVDGPCAAAPLIKDNYFTGE